MSEVFTTERLVVRPWSADDVEAAYAIYSDWEVARWLGSVPRAHESLDDSREWLGRVVSREDPPGMGCWAVTVASGPPIGTVMLRPLPESDDVEVGWHFGRAHWGNGYATEAARGALRRGFEDVELDVVNAVVYPDNERSQAVCRRLGMRHEGPTTRWYGVELEHFTITAEDCRSGS